MWFDQEMTISLLIFLFFARSKDWLRTSQNGNWINQILVPSAHCGQLQVSPGVKLPLLLSIVGPLLVSSLTWLETFGDTNERRKGYGDCRYRGEWVGGWVDGYESETILGSTSLRSELLSVFFCCYWIKQTPASIKRFNFEPNFVDIIFEMKETKNVKIGILSKLSQPQLSGQQIKLESNI